MSFQKVIARIVLEVLADLFLTHGPPEHIRSHSGPVFVEKALRERLARLGVQSLFSEPGSPLGNGYCESFSSKLRDELLNGEIF
jgi:putative transposase